MNTWLHDSPTYLLSFYVICLIILPIIIVPFMYFMYACVCENVFIGFTKSDSHVVIFLSFSLSLFIALFHENNLLSVCEMIYKNLFQF